MKKVLVFLSLVMLSCGSEEQQPQEPKPEPFYTVPAQQACESWIVNETIFFHSQGIKTYIDLKANGGFRYYDDHGTLSRGIYTCFTDRYEGTFTVYVTEASEVGDPLPVCKMTCGYSATDPDQWGYSDFVLDCDYIILADGETGIFSAIMFF